jgi:hypothetical protein
MKAKINLIFLGISLVAFGGYELLLPLISNVAGIPQDKLLFFTTNNLIYNLFLVVTGAITLKIAVNSQAVTIVYKIFAAILLSWSILSIAIGKNFGLIELSQIASLFGLIAGSIFWYFGSRSQTAE